MSATHNTSYEKPTETQSGTPRNIQPTPKDKKRDSEELCDLIGFLNPGAKPASGARQPLFRR
jgi:hypothetical protein